MQYHCFFEQSGTFKNEFRKLGYMAYDYDILNDFRETDYQMDLFEEILLAYENKPSIFDELDKNEDTILAFFPVFDLKTKYNFNLEELHFKCKNGVMSKS